MSNSPSLLSPEQSQKAVNSIIDYFATERNEEIGIIAAEDILDLILSEVGNEIFNKAVDETKQVISNRMEEIMIDVEVLKK